MIGGEDAICRENSCARVDEESTAVGVLSASEGQTIQGYASTRLNGDEPEGIVTVEADVMTGAVDSNAAPESDCVGKGHGAVVGKGDRSACVKGSNQSLVGAVTDYAVAECITCRYKGDNKTDKENVRKLPSQRAGAVDTIYAAAAVEGDRHCGPGGWACC